MALVTCAGADVLAARLHLGARGAWWGRLRLDTATAPSGKVRVEADGGFTLHAAVASGGVFCEVAEVHVVGGAGGLGATVKPAAYQNAQLRDPLNAVLKAGGESLSATTPASVLSVLLTAWTVAAVPVARALDELCGIASTSLGQAIEWRVLEDGTVWLGTETWPRQKLRAGDQVLEAYPAEGRYLLGIDAPWLMPGVALDQVGKVVLADHWIAPNEVRTWAWT